MLCISEASLLSAKTSSKNGIFLITLKTKKLNFCFKQKTPKLVDDTVPEEEALFDIILSHKTVQLILDYL